MEEKKLAGRISTERIQEFPLKVARVNPQRDTPWHRHNFVELVLIEQGEADHDFNGKRLRVKAKEILLIPRGTTHAYWNCTADFSLINILFIPEALPLARLDSYLLPGFKILMEQNTTGKQDVAVISDHPAEYRLLSDLAYEMIREDQNQNPGYLFIVQGAFMVILGHLARLLTQGNGKKRDCHLHLSLALSYLNKHFREALDVRYLCRISGMSRPSFQRNFLRATGTTPLQYLLKLRLTEAATLLRGTERPVTEIAFRLGFEGSNYFCRLFKKHSGFTPRQYRKNCESDSSFSIE